jgi:hypothetical protein
MKIICDSFDDFVQKFRLLFDGTGSDIVLAPVRTGKSYQCEKFIFDTILNKKIK